MKVELTLPDGLVPEGSKIEFRIVKEGELYLSNSPIVAASNEIKVYVNSSQDTLQAECNPLGKGKVRFVVIPPYQWPDCIPEGWWIAMDSNGSWFTYSREPEMRRTCFGGDRVTGPLQNLNITLPTVTDWRQSKMQKPVKNAS